MPPQDREQRLQARLAQLEQRVAATGQLDRERLMQISADVIRTITEPAFVERMGQARIAADEGAGFDAAARLLSIDGLREAGVDIPADFRMTSRIFEDRVEGSRFEIQSPLEPGDILPAFGACAGAGGLTFCGCGGFSI